MCRISDFDKLGAKFGCWADSWPPEGGSEGGRMARGSMSEGKNRNP